MRRIIHTGKKGKKLCRRLLEIDRWIAVGLQAPGNDVVEGLMILSAARDARSVPSATERGVVDRASKLIPGRMELGTRGRRSSFVLV
jgi:hypothetical protein